MDQDANLTIEEFWRHILPGRTQVNVAGLVKGWEANREPMPGFTEAPLILNRELSDAETDLSECSMILVSAPGAVGKTTLAKGICARAGAVYVDLAQAATVGGYALSGGLLSSGLWSDWTTSSLGLVIDALDEARTRVTEEAFEDFFRDVVSLTNSSNIPPILFGRTGAIEHAWLWLKYNLPPEKKMVALQIGFYDPGTAIEFAFNALRNDPKLIEIQRGNGRDAPTSVQREAIGLILEGLRAQLEYEEQTRFAGYAPVLMTVASRVASEPNTVTLINQLNAGASPSVTVESINAAILERESGKLDRLTFVDATLREKLYRPDEQLDYLSERLYGTSSPDLPDMNPHDAEAYRNALETWIGEHPFLNGLGTEASSAVFEAHICLHALKKGSSRVLDEQISRERMANPFLSELYSAAFADPETIPAEHVGVIYASIRARLASGQRANLEVYEPSEDGSDGALDFVIWVSRPDGNETLAYGGRINRSGTVRLGPYVEDVDIEAQNLKVELGGTDEINVVAPVSITCETLAFEAKTMVVSGDGDSLVSLKADNYDGHIEKITGRENLRIKWPGGNRYPWNPFYTEDLLETELAESEHTKIYMRIRRFVVLFRVSRYHNRLAAYKMKIEHRRRTRGIGQRVWDKLLEAKICRLEEPMYILGPDLLKEKTGLDYIQFRKGQGQDNKTFLEFVKTILS